MSLVAAKYIIEKTLNLANVIGVGDIKVCLRANGPKGIVNVVEVFYVDDLRENMLS